MFRLKSRFGVVAIAGLAWAGPWASADVFVATAPGSGPPAWFHFAENAAPLPGNSVVRAESYEGMTVGPDGNVYIAGNNLGAGSVSVFNGATGAFLRTFSVPPGLGSTARYTLPSGLAFGPEGDLYVTSNRLTPTFANSISGLLRLDPATGTLKETPVNFGTSTTADVRDVAFGPNGQPFVSSAFGIVTTAAPGESDFAAGRIFIPTGTGGLASPTSVAFGPDGNLYVNNFSNTSNTVLRFNASTGAFIDTFLPANAGGVGQYADMAFDAGGNLLVTSATGNSIYKFNGATGSPMGVFVTAGNGSLRALATGTVPEPAVGVLAGAALLGLRRKRVGTR
jgi:WD40 repeat protein